MKIGVFIGTQHPANASMLQALQDHVEQVRAMRDAGFDSVWIGQHYLTAPEQFLQTTPLLARLAAEAGDMAVGTNLLLLPLHDPVQIAEQYATMDVITAGRLILGLGLGYRDIEYETFGVAPKTRVSRFVEGVEIVRRLWTEDNVTFNGKHFRFSNLSIRPRPLQVPRPPIWIGATTDAAVARAGAIGDAWIGSPLTTVTVACRQAELFERARHDAGLPRATERAKCVEVGIAKDRAVAFNRAAYALVKYRSYYSWGQDEIAPGDSGAQFSIEELAKDRFIVGTPDDCVRGCLEHRDRLGITHLIVRFNFPGMPQSEVLDEIRLFGRAVIPEVHRMTA